MANAKITALTALGAAPATNDLIPVVDVSDSTDAATGTTKKMTVANLMTAPTISDFTNANHDHADADDGGQLTDAALSTAVGIAKGGTGQTTATAAFDALAPTTTAGDIIYHNGSDNVRLPKGTAGQVLKMNDAATAPAWVSSAGGVGSTTYDMSTASGTQNIAHGLGRTPTKVRLVGIYGTTAIINRAETVYNGTTQASLSFFIDAGANELNSTTFRFAVDGSNYTAAVVTFDSTNIILTWTKTGTPTGTANLIWEAE